MRDQRRRRDVAASVIGGAVGEPARDAAGSRAGSRSAIRSRSGPAQSMIPRTAAKLSCQPTSPPNRGLISSVAAAASSGG